MLTGVILAGGLSLRMGGHNKALLSFSNERLIERQIRLMKQICEEIIVVTNDPMPLLPILGNSVRIITDFIPGRGPLSGMHAALSLSKHSNLWVVGCDMPFISHQAIKQMWIRQQELQLDAVIPYLNGRTHPLHGLYNKSCLHAISNLLEKEQYKVYELFNHIRSEFVEESFFADHGLDIRFVMNVNTPEEYEQALYLDDLPIVSRG